MQRRTAEERDLAGHGAAGLVDDVHAHLTGLRDAERGADRAAFGDGDRDAFPFGPSAHIGRELPVAGGQGAREGAVGLGVFADVR